MSESDLPPVLGETPPPLPAPRPRWRWAVHTGLLAAYVIGLGLAGAILRRGGDKGAPTPAMPSDLGALAKICAGEMIGFLLIFLLACVFSRVSRDELFLKWRGGLRPILLGMVYSVALRIAIAIVTIAMFLPVVLTKGKEAVEEMRPKTEAVVNMEAVKDPAYMLFAVTVVSFVVAGFREELWRVGMMAGLAGLAPAIFSSRKGQFYAVLIAAIIFGFGHLPQGWGGVVVTAALGVGLGTIIILHRSAWEAILAHGFFDATTFAALYVILKYFPEALKQFASVG